MQNKPLVSVIIPSFNRVQLVGNAIDSALNQTYTPIQVIVVDDGSTDGTEAVLRKYGNQIEYVVQKKQGQAVARNTGLLLAKGSLVSTLDSDDIWDTTFLETCVEQLEKHNLDFVFTNWHQETREGKWIDSFSRYTFLQKFISNKKKDVWINFKYNDLRKLYIRYCPSPSSSSVIRRSSMVAGWNGGMNIADDWCMLLDIVLSKPCRVAFTQKKLWTKGINTINLCDGRNLGELYRYMAQDAANFKLRFAKKISKYEYHLLNDFYIEQVVKLAFYTFIIETKYKFKSDSFKNFLYSLRKAPYPTCRIFMFYATKYTMQGVRKLLHVKSRYPAMLNH